MDIVENSVKVLSELEIKERESNCVNRMYVSMTPEKQEYIKRLMFEALEDPRKNYTNITFDDMTKDWKQKEGC